MASQNQISISPGNNKMGLIPSVSLPPVKTCTNCKHCAKKCYAAKLARLRPTVRNAWERNLDILNSDPASYWTQVRGAAATTRFFRFHVAGDITGPAYFAEMVKTAEQLPRTEFLVFTKNYPVVNSYLDAGNVIPENLHVIFSAWGDDLIPENPHKLPESNVIFKGEKPRENWKICGGNCAECACAGLGCWTVKNGETVAFYEH